MTAMRVAEVLSDAIILGWPVQCLITDSQLHFIELLPVDHYPVHLS